MTNREQAIDQVIDIIKKHRTHQQNVYIECGMLGTELLFVTVASHFKVKVLLGEIELSSRCK